MSRPPLHGWIGVDLDATLAHYGGWRGGQHIGEPIEPMIARVRAWIAEGREVRVFTARASDPEQVPPVRAWLDGLGLSAVGITNVKDFAMVELWDDRCVQVKPNTGVAYGPSRIDGDVHVSTTVPDEAAALRAQVEHLTDLVRHARGPLHEDGLLTDAEYAALAEDSGAVVRLTTIAQLQGDVARETRAKNVAIGERDEARADVAWLTEEVTQQTGATVDSVAEGLALARAGGIHRPVVNVRMGDALRARFAAENERDAANRDADTYRQILAGKLRRTDLAAARNGDLMPGPVALVSLVLADMIEAKPEAKNRLSWSWDDARTGKGYRVMVEHENGESFAAALRAARLDGARAMREAAEGVVNARLTLCRNGIERLYDADGDCDRPEDLRAARGRESMYVHVIGEIRALDAAAVVGSGSSIHAALPSPDAYQWSATGPNGCLLLSPADCIVARIDRDGTGWRPQIPGRGPLKWAADFPSAVGQVREVLGDIVPDGSVVVGSGS